MFKSQNYLDRHRFFPWILLCGSIIVTFLVWYVVDDFINQSLQERFEHRVLEIDAALVKRMLNYEQILRGTQGLFAASVEVNRDEWHQYVAAQKTSERFPGIQALGYSQIIGRSDKLSEHIDKIRNEGFPDYTIHPTGERELYHSIVYIEPMDERNLQAFGLDMSFEQNRYEAMLKARDTGESALTRKITLIQETDEDVQAGFLMIIPIYTNGIPHETVSQRQEAIQGYVYAAFRMNDLMSGTLSEHSDITYIIFDEEISDQNIMFESSSNMDHSKEFSFNQQKISTINFGDRNWIVDYYTIGSMSTVLENIIPILILSFGFLMSGFLFYTSNSFNSSRIRIGKLTKATEQFSGGLEMHIDSSLKDSKHETANLAKAFEKMQKTISTKNKQLEENVEELEKINVLKEEFTAMISHELKTPLSPIIGWCDALMDKEVSGELSDAQKEAVHTIKLNGLKLLSLIGDMLDAQTLEMGKMKFEKNNFKISELFENIQKNYESILGEGKNKLVFLNHNSISITSDKKRIEQVISNLINNSLEFISKEKGIIEISANEDNKSIIFSVKDNGKGIPKEYQEQIFKKFYQIDTSERRAHEGVGLGLSISKGIVEGLGGDIWIKNGEEHGTNFCFSVPKGDLN